VTPDGVTRFRPDGVRESVRWDQLAEVGIHTTDDGPWSEDFFWLLIASDGIAGCAVPNGAEGADGLLATLQKLPGFDNETVVEAMGSTTNAQFVCWKRTTPGKTISRPDKRHRSRHRHPTRRPGAGVRAR